MGDRSGMRTEGKDSRRGVAIYNNVPTSGKVGMKRIKNREVTRE